MIFRASFKKFLLRNLMGSLAGALITALLGGILLLNFGGRESLGKTLARASYNIPFLLRPSKKVTEAVIIEMDKESRQLLQQPTDGPWDRGLHAKLINRLCEDGAEVIVFDLLFSEPGEKAQTDALAKAMRACKKVVIATVLEPGLGVAPQFGLEATEPLEELREASRGVGISTLFPDPDVMIRRQFLGHQDGSRYVPSLAASAAEAAGIIGIKGIQRLGDNHWLNYYGPSGTIPHLNYSEALNSDRIPKDFFKGKAVFVGQGADSQPLRSRLDRYRNPCDGSGYFDSSSGLEVQATSFLNLARGDSLRRLDSSFEMFLVFALGAISGFGIAKFRFIPAVAITFGLAGVTLLVSTIAVWKLGGWWAWLVFAGIQLPTALACSTISNSLLLLNEKAMLKKSLAFHLPEARINQIMEESDVLKPGGEKTELTIFFSDIANFTRITARMDAGDLFRLLNNYFEASLGCIHESGGTVVKLIGDSIFAVWKTPPSGNASHQELACRAALLLQQRLRQFDTAESALPLVTRVGLHTGFAYVGNVGSSNRFDYTAIGENVNLASRLEGFNKVLGTRVLLTRDTQKAVEHLFASRNVGHFRFQGMDRIVEVYELISDDTTGQDTQSWRDSFAKGLFHFQRKEFDLAEAAMRYTLETRPLDGPSIYYLGKISEYRSANPGTHWTGEIEVQEK